MILKFNSIRGILFLHIILLSVVFSGCDLYDNFRNNTPKINSFIVPSEVQYGETVEFRVTAFDPEDNTLSYLWDVSDGVLRNETEPKVEWIAPTLPEEEVVPPKTITVYLSVRDGGEQEVTKSATIVVYSKAYKIANTLRGSYELIRTQINGETVDSLGGSMRLTTTTFSREFEEDSLFFSGSYNLVEPYSENKGTINWHPDGTEQLTVSTYTWDGQLLVIYSTDTATTHVYEKRN